MAAVAINRGPGPFTVTLSPADGTSLRAVERALLIAGVQTTVAHDTRQVYVPVAEFHKVYLAFRSWRLDLDPSMQVEVEVLARQDRSADVGKRILGELADPAVVEELLKDFPERTRLDPHQREAVALIAHPDVSGVCLFDEQGLGKTVSTLFSFHRLRTLGAVTRMLIVSPKNMVFEWVRETERFFGEAYTAQAVVGTAREKRDALNRPADIYVTNFETPVTLFLRLKELLDAAQGRAFLVVDESFFVKNADARRTQSLKKLRRVVGRCLVLCGTPAPNSPNDLVEQFNIADGGTTFRGVKLPPERDAARPIVRRVIEERGVYLRRLKQDVLPDLPGKTFNRVLVPLQPVQRRAYERTLVDLITDLQAVDDLTFKKNIASFIARRVALLQICSNPVSVLGEYEETPAKLLALDSILEELIEKREEKVIVWSFFTASIDAICDRFAKYRPARFDGVVSDPVVRRESVRLFQEDIGGAKLFVANPAAAGAGLTLHKARYAVYESMSNQAAHYLQSLDRIHRRGQTREVEYLVLLCDATVELQEYDRLTEKEQAAQELLGDHVIAPVTRETMLDEAVAASRLLF
jgi:SNF2 family DNA or RNA helicase